MVRRFFARLFGNRYSMAIAISVALVIVCINEYTYRSTVSVLRGGIALTDERISAGRLLQALTDAESGQRSYLLTRDPAFLIAYKNALAELPRLRLAVVRALGVHSPKSESQINDVIDRRLSEMVTTIALVDAGSGQFAFDIVKAGASRQWTDQLRQVFEDEMSGAAQRQSVARLSIYDALAVNHAVVIVLTLSSFLALYFFIRQLRLQEQERQATEERLELEIKGRTVELRQLAQHLQTVREAEKDHLARELHDQLGALLTVAKLDLEGLRNRVEKTSELTARLDRLASRLNEVIVLKRRMVEDMRPSSLSMLGLRTTLEQHCREVSEAMEIPFHVNIDEVSLASEAELVIFRFVQEAVTNIVKYSQAKNVWVQLLKNESSLDILVRDDGVGFDAKIALMGHHGLTGMRYRIDSLGGVMTLASSPGAGTTISASISA